MNDQYWGWILSVLGLTGFWVTGKKIWWGWWLNVGAQTVWYAYAIATEQWGFLAMTTMYTIIFTKNAIAWTKDHRRKQRIVEGLRKSVAATVLTPNETRQIILKKNGL